MEGRCSDVSRLSKDKAFHLPKLFFPQACPRFIGEIIALILASGETLTGPFPWGVGMRNSLDVKI